MRRLILLSLFASCTKATPPTPAPVATVTASGPRAAVEPSPMQPQRLRIIGTNDFHGALEPRPDSFEAMRGGGAYMAAAIRKAERECRQPECVTILLDGGDMFQGTAASNLLYGRSVVDLYNYLGYSAAAVGNHEFDWGQDTLRALMRAANYPILAANVRDPAGRDVPWIPNDTIIQRGPFKVGIIGVIRVDAAATAFPQNVAGLTFVDAAPIIDSIAPRLRARGADFVIVVGHIAARCDADGLGPNCSGEAIALAQRLTTRIDAVVSGHSHTRVSTTVNGIPLVQARLSGRAIDIIDLYTSGAPAHREVREVYSDSITPDPDAANIVAAARRRVDQIAPQMNRPVAQIAKTMVNTQNEQRPLGNLVADAMRVVGGGDVAVINSGGIREVLHAGMATYGTLFEVMPFGNALIRVRVRGSDLRAYFDAALSEPRLVAGKPDMHVSGARIVYHAGPSPVIDTITILGRPLNDQAVYTVVINDFMAAGGDRLGFGSAALSSTPANTGNLEALVAYLSSLPQPVNPPADQRLIRRP